MNKEIFEPKAELKFLSGGGEMGALMRTYNWYDHPLGDPSQWPTSLKNSIQLILHSAFPMFLWWGKELYMFHNDPYIPALGEKHPEALGSSARVMWAEIWDSLWKQLGGSIDSILKEGKCFYAEDLPLSLKRKGFLEETFWTFSYSPAYDDEGNIGGMFCSCYESTRKVLAQRRLKTIKDLAAATAQTRTLPDIGNQIKEVLCENEKDLPFALYYTIDSNNNQATRVLVTRDNLENISPVVIELNDNNDRDVWKLNKLMNSKQTMLIENFSRDYFPIRCGWGDLVEQAIVIPVFKSGQPDVRGFFIAGISPKLEFDDDYLSFFNLIIGQINLAITNLQIIQKEKELLSKTEEERKNLYKVLMQAPAPVCILRGPEHVFELVNKLYQRLVGKREIEGKPIREALPELEGQGIYELLDQVYQTGKTFIGQELKVLLVPDEGVPAEDVYFTFVYEALRGDNNEITGVIVLCFDVTAQVIAKQNLNKYVSELATKNNELLKVNIDLDNFIYTASHDLKAPVSNLEGLFYSLFDEIEQKEDVIVIKGLVEKSFERFKNTIKDLTEISKAQKNDHDEAEQVILPDLIEEVREGIKDQIEKSGGKIETKFEVKEIRFSRKNLRSILYNLISNAFKYSRPDEPPVVKISTMMEGNNILISISDNGLGISPENHSKIFQMFKRLHDHVEGTGIGLYIVKRIIENAGGKIEVSSEVGKGSTFKIYIPVS